MILGPPQLRVAQEVVLQFLDELLVFRHVSLLLFLDRGEYVALDVILELLDVVVLGQGLEALALTRFDGPGYWLLVVLLGDVFVEVLGERRSALVALVSRLEDLLVNCRVTPLTDQIVVLLVQHFHFFLVLYLHL